MRSWNAKLQRKHDSQEWLFVRNSQPGKETQGETLEGKGASFAQETQRFLWAAAAPGEELQLLGNTAPCLGQLHTPS